MKKGMEMQMPPEWGAERKPYHMGHQLQMSGRNISSDKKEETKSPQQAQTPSQQW